MSNTELQNLQSVLRHSPNNEASVHRALVSYLKSSDETMNYNLIGGTQVDDDIAQCKIGETTPAYANDCARLLNKCLNGDKEDECAKEFLAVKEGLTNGLLFRQADKSTVERLLNKLGIDVTQGQAAVGVWLDKINKKDRNTALQISKNDALKTVLNAFVQKVNPKPTGVLVDASPLPSAFPNIPTRVSCFRKEPNSIEDLPMRPVPCKKGGQTGGGLLNVGSTFERFIDGVDTIADMRGGGEAKALYEPLSETYNSLIDSLKYQGKKIEDSDDAHIRNLLSELNVTEEKLFKTAEIIKNFNKAKEHPETARLLGGSQVPDRTMADVYKRYEELEIRQAGGAKNIKDILKTIYNALQGKDASGNNVAPSKVNKNFYDALTSY